MTESEKTKTWKNIEGLRSHGSTNLWSGIREGLNVFEGTDRIGNVQGMFVLTDGVPNHMCPSRGYVKKLEPILNTIRQEQGDGPLISCFGFGYQLRSALMRSIAEVGKGIYAFIPDAGMIGTVFIHAIANLFSTCSSSVRVTIACPNPDVEIVLPSYLEFDAEPQVVDTRVLHLGAIQYGQSRDIIIQLNNASPNDKVTATIRYLDHNQAKQIANTECRLYDRSRIPRTTIDYHVSRHELCTFLASLSTKNQNNEHVSLPANSLHTECHAIGPLVERIQSRLTVAAAMDPPADTTDLAALLADLQSPDPGNPHGSGQISLALQLDRPAPSPSVPGKTIQRHTYRIQEQSHYQRWGTHYIPSVLHAHMRQICITFKDPGPLRYGISSPLFMKMRDELDDAFDKLPAPKGSLNRHDVHRKPVRMSRYHSSSNPCFAAECQVRMSDDVSYRKLEDLRTGDVVWTPRGGRPIRAVVMTPIDRVGFGLQDMCHVSNDGGASHDHEAGLWITPYHPVYHSPSNRWVFPKDIATGTKVMTAGAVYSILLESDEDVDAHAINVGGILCVTLGHGLTHSYSPFRPQTRPEAQSNHLANADSTKRPEEVDVRSHAFFGSYARVLESISRLRKDKYGRYICGGISKAAISPDEDIACDFVKLLEPDGDKKEVVDGYPPPKRLSLEVRCLL